MAVCRTGPGGGSGGGSSSSASAKGGGLPYWIVACSTDEGHSAEQIYASVKQAVLGAASRGNALCDEACMLDIPALKFGSFDDLIRSVDVLQRQDAFVEGVLRRVERQAVDIDAHCELKIVWQRHPLTVEQYIRRFAWDDAKYPRMRAVRENLEMLVQHVTKTDDELRAKVAVWQEVRQQAAAARGGGGGVGGGGGTLGAGGKGEGGADGSRRVNYTQRELLDVLTPEVVRPDDFVTSEHLTTAVVVVPHGAEKEWENCYESLDPFVVPRSSRPFAVPEDTEGNTLWRVVLFKKSLQRFKQQAQQKKFIVKEFVYSEKAYSEAVLARSKAEAEMSKQETFLSRICFAAFSDVFIAWMHLKAMRTFCEAVLRFGVPPHFAAFVLHPASEGKKKKLRKELDKLFAAHRGFGNKYFEATADDATGTPEEEEFYSYVWVPLQPFAGTGRLS